MFFFAMRFGRRPDVSRRRRAEEFFVAVQSAGVPVLELMFFGRAAFGRMMMKGFAQNFGAENFPIIFGLGEMQVPGLIDLLGRRDGMPGRNSEEGEALVFADDALGVGGRPVIFPGKPGRERKRRFR